MKFSTLIALFAVSAISESSIAAETETVIEIVQTEVFVLEAETRDVTSDVETNSAISAFRRFKPKAIQSIAFILNGGYPITVYARNGKKVWASECFLSEVTVGDINQDLSNTALYCQGQYQAVNAKTWADKAYVMNEEVIAA